MNRLIGLLGNAWTYELESSGGSLRVAILFDGNTVRKNNCVEFQVPPSQVQGSDIFARDPLVCYFVFLDATGAAKNDFLVVGLHLASGQDKNQNHNQAMQILRQWLK